MAAQAQALPQPRRRFGDIGFAVCIAAIIVVLFLPIPAFIVDMGLAASVTLSILILMVALWIERPLDFSAFPMVLLVATILRLALNVATTRLILSHGAEGQHAAGYVVGGFANLVMAGDFVIGTVVFVILLTVNFIVITKGATRIAEVGARFTLDAIPGKQMAIDADLSAGLIDDAEARKRRTELELESSFYGSMDGASKFVRGDAIAGLIITFINSFGGIIIGVTRHNLDFASAADAYIKLTVGDGLATQIPALIVSLGAGLLVSKGSNRGTAESAILRQLGGYPRAMIVASGLLFLLAVMPGLPFLPFAVLGAGLVAASIAVSRGRLNEEIARQERQAESDASKSTAERTSAKELLRTSEIELSLGRQLTGILLSNQSELAHRVAKMRKKFAQQFGFIIPEIELSDDLNLAPKNYSVKIHGTLAASYELRPGEVMVVTAGRKPPTAPGDPIKEPAFGLEAMWVPDMFAADLKAEGFNTFDIMSVMLTHLSEVIRNNLAQLLSYRDLRMITESLEPEYKRLLDEIVPSLLTFSTLQAILKLLLAERVSIRNLQFILEAIAEVAPHVRKPEIIVEHVRIRLAQQICGDISAAGPLHIIRLGGRWDVTFMQSLKRDNKGEVVEFDLDPKALEAFAQDASRIIKPALDSGNSFAVVTTPEARPYVRLIIDRIFPNLPVLSHLEVSKAANLSVIASLS
ncbi:MAG: flagellar biosynthesis protein FlhA [Rhizobiales bacterium]|nr:flagellar biosynthesis protein FlhA [Hyphomicrobiales bacterium]